MPSHHNKQTTEAEAPTDAWVLTESNLREWFLGPYEKQKQVINDAKKKVKETEGESNKMLNDLLEQTLYHDESVMERRLRDYAFSAELGLKELSAYVFPENKASIRVLEKNRMKNIVYSILLT